MEPYKPGKKKKTKKIKTKTTI